MATRRLLHNNKGTSLVEVLVVMVVLAVGILTAVQMFPPGFLVVKAAQSQTIASKLAQTEMERWKNMAANLPDGIVAVSDVDGTIVSDETANPSAPLVAWQKNSDGSLVMSNGNPVRGNAFNTREVLGETTTIPVGSYFNTGAGTVYGSKYDLAFSPIDVHFDSNGMPIDLKIKSGDLERQSEDHVTDPLPSLQPGQYAIDYGGQFGSGGPYEFWVAFPQHNVGAGNSVTYYVSYSYWATQNSSGNQALLSVTDQELNVTVDSTGISSGAWISVPITPPSGYTPVQVDPYSDSCARAFVPVANGSWTAGNPYQFALADAFLGVIAFNPAGHGSYEATAEGTKPIEARIDYKIFDLRILHEDRDIITPPAVATNIPVKLALPFILNVGDMTDNPDDAIDYSPNGPQYQGLAPALGYSCPLVIVDLATGLRVEVQNPDGSSPAYVPLPATKQYFNFDAGVVYLPLTAALVDPETGAAQQTGVRLAGRHLRFFYRVDGDWSVQCQKAYSVYQQVYPQGSNTSPDYRHYMLESGQPATLDFAACDAGKTVSVDYAYVDSSGQEHKVVGESHKISDATDANNAYYITLDQVDGTNTTLGRIYAVVGTSFKVRVVWRDSKQWRHVDLDTSLIRQR